MKIGLGKPIWRDDFPKENIRIELPNKKPNSTFPRFLKAVFRPGLTYAQTMYEFHGFTIKARYDYREDVIDFAIDNGGCPIKIHYYITATDDNEDNEPFLTIDHYIFGESEIEEFLKYLLDAREVCGLLRPIALEVYEFAKDPEKFAKDPEKYLAVFKPAE